MAVCGFDPRGITLDSPTNNLEVGDTLTLTAHALFGGGCAIMNWPGATGGVINGAYPQPSAIVFWGDGQTSALTIAANGTLTGSHQYTQSVQQGTALTIVLTAYPWDAGRGGPWLERLTNMCDGAGENNVPWGQLAGIVCTPHPGTISVFAAQPPSAGIITQPVAHGKVAIGGLAIILQDAAPACGMKVTVATPSMGHLRVGDSSPNPSSPPVPPANPVVVVVPAGKYAYNFDIDAAQVPPGTYAIDISSAGKTVTVDVTVH